MLSMGGASDLLGKQITGQRTGKIWTVVELIKSEPGNTPGHFSICYRLLDVNGGEAFLKASDISLALEKSDPLQALVEISTYHQFERTILEHCKGNKLDRVVTAIDSGQMSVISNGTQDFVFFIVFEMAKGDLRKFAYAQQGGNLVWIISAMHNFSTAVAQIHGAGIFHNDLKPANVLVFEDAEKVADFGRATSPTHPVRHDRYLCAGDMRFAAPEQLYHNENPATNLDPFLKSRAGDLYNLGSIMHFLITKRSLTPEIVNRLEAEHKPPNTGSGWLDGYETVLPHWRQKFNIIMTEFYDDVPEFWTKQYQFALDDIRKIIISLCEPDFRLRGDLSSTVVQPGKYSLERVISKLDNLRSRVLVISRAS
jgi:eukaryotic-like serine/threonine-protein kinase